VQKQELTPQEQIDHQLAVMTIYSTIIAVFVICLILLIPDLSSTIRPMWVTGGGIACLAFGIALMAISIIHRIKLVTKLDREIRNHTPTPTGPS
jgi:hypothetical protein